MDEMLGGEVCEALNVSPATVRAMAFAGEIPWRRARSGQRLYSRTAVEALREATSAHPLRRASRPDPANGGPPVTRPVDHLTTAEVARLFGVTAKTVARWADEERLPYTLNERLVRYFPRGQVEALRAQMSHGGG